MSVEYKKKGRIAILTMNRPEAMNAINSQVRQELNEAMIDFRDDRELWVAIITGAGDKAFSAGADIKEMRPGPREPEAGTIDAVRPDSIWKPFIAAINGYCLGGGLELALECDLRIAAEHARFGQPEVLRGFLPGGGAPVRLPRFVPRAKAAELLLMGQYIDAREAYDIGLINKVVSLDQLMATALEWADVICQAAPLGVRAAKECMIRGHSLPLEEALLLNQALSRSLAITEDYREGTRAFVEKRKPVWKAK